jgi:hypothetical protein
MRNNGMRMIKKILTIILVFTALYMGQVNAQDFTIEVDNYYLVDTLGSEIIFNVHLKNNSSSDILVTIVRREISIPATWTSSLCFERCFRSDIDSISTSVDFGSSPLTPDESCEMSLHVFPLMEDAESIIELKFVNENNPVEQYIEEFRAASAIISVDNKNTGTLEYQLSQNYPNPFNPSTNIEYTVSSNVHGEMSNVTLKIYDILGREIITLVNREQSSGNYKVKFNAGKRIPSGVYFYELRTNNFHQVKKMILEK